LIKVNHPIILLFLTGLKLLENKCLCDHLKKCPGTAAPATIGVAGHHARPPCAKPPCPFRGCLVCIKAEEWMNKVLQVPLLFLSLKFNSQHALLYEQFQPRIERSTKDSVRCLDKNLPILSCHCFTSSPVHATAIVIDVVAVTTAAWSLPLHHHSNRRLRSCHTVVCQRGPHRLPLTDRLTDRWSPQTQTPLHEVVGGDRVSSTVGVAPIELH
jgi:hypothetical protein